MSRLWRSSAYAAGLAALVVAIVVFGGLGGSLSFNPMQLAVFGLAGLICAWCSSTVNWSKWSGRMALGFILVGSIAPIALVLMLSERPWLIGPGLSWAVAAVYGGCMMHLAFGLAGNQSRQGSWWRALMLVGVTAVLGWWAGLGLELFLGVKHGGVVGALVGIGAGTGAPYGKAGEGALIAATGAGMLFVVAILQRLDLVDSARHVALMTSMMACVGLALAVYAVIRFSQPQWQDRSGGVPVFTGWFASWMTVLALVYAVALM